MALSAATLATQLAGIAGATEAEAIDDWADAWAAYFAGAVAAVDNVSFTTNPTLIGVLKTAMKLSMTGLATDGKTAIKNGIVAWWSSMTSAPNSYFTGASAISVPANLADIATDMEDDVFAANMLETEIAPAMTRLANFLHTKSAGGTATISGNARTIG